MKTKHTKTKWFISEQGANGVFVTNEKKSGAIAKVYSPNSLVNSQEETLANAKLIAESPNMLETIIRSYLELLVNMPMQYRFTSNGQMLLVNLRHSLHFLFEDDAIETQAFFEDLQCRIKLGELTIEQAIKEVI